MKTDKTEEKDTLQLDYQGPTQASVKGREYESGAWAKVVSSVILMDF